MTGTPRRSFLKGLFAGVVGGGAVSGLEPDWATLKAGIVVRATPKEVQAFANPLERDQPVATDQLLEGDGVSDDLYASEALYNSAGEPVAVVTRLEVRQAPISIGSFEDHWTQHVAGPLRVHIEAFGLRAPRYGPDDEVHL